METDPAARNRRTNKHFCQSYVLVHVIEIKETLIFKCKSDAPLSVDSVFLVLWLKVNNDPLSISFVRLCLFCFSLRLIE